MCLPGLFFGSVEQQPCSTLLIHARAIISLERALVAGSRAACGGPDAAVGCVCRFAIFFPLRSPLYLPAGSDLEVHFWRCVGPTKVSATSVPKSSKARHYKNGLHGTRLCALSLVNDPLLVPVASGGIHVWHMPALNESLPGWLPRFCPRRAALSVLFLSISWSTGVVRMGRYRTDGVPHPQSQRAFLLGGPIALRNFGSTFVKQMGSEECCVKQVDLAVDANGGCFMMID